MLLPLLTSLTLISAQSGEPIAPTPFDQVFELEITEYDEPAIEGHGGTTVAEYEALFEGTLHIWAESELDIFLRVDDAAQARTLASDDNSGGGTTPYIALEVEPGDWLVVLVASELGATGPLTLHLIATPDTEAVRAAARRSRDLYASTTRLAQQGEQSSARDLFARALPEINAPGMDHHDLLGARMNLAISMQSMGDLAGARALFELIHVGCERTLPEDHPQLQVARGNLARSMQSMGDLSGARGLNESVLASRERTLPEDHPDLLRTRASLAVSMEAMGDRAGARLIQESVLAGWQRTLPEDHPQLVLARSNLAVSIHQIGDLAGARALYETVLASRERTLPEDHADLLLARRNLAVSMDAMGDLTGARALHESVVAAYERTLPSDHPQLLRARASLAVAMQQMGDRAGARSLHESVLASYERSLPQDHPDVLLSRMNLAGAMHEMGDLADARALRESVLAGYELSLPDDHLDLLRAKANLAVSMYAMGDLDGARALHETVLAARERTLPESHPSLLRARSNLARSRSAADDLAGARALLPAQIDGIQTRILASLALAPRQARQTVASEGLRHSEVLAWSESAGTELERSAFELTETMRLVAAEAARSLARFETDEELAPILKKAAGIRRALNDLIARVARDETGADDLPAELTRLSLERDALERVATRRLSERGVVTNPVSSIALSAALGPGDLAVGFRRIARKQVDRANGESQEAADHMLAHVLTPRGDLRRVDLGPASELEELANAWRTTLGAPLSKSFGLDFGEGDPERAVGRALRAKVLDPVLALSGGSVKRLFICADDLLFLLPLDALPTDGEERIGDRVRIVNELSFARLLSHSSATDGAPSLLAFGGVDYDAQGAGPGALLASSAPVEASITDGTERGGTSRSAFPMRFEELVQSRHEAEATADLFEKAFDIEPTLLTRKGTTKTALFDSAGGSRYLHLATHGWFAPESVRSTEDARPAETSFARMGIEERVSGLAPMTLCGLALAGANRGRDSLGRVPGILTAEELCSLDLSQCELAVLSACETNVGIRRAGQGIQSLQSAIYAAGARTSITSLWKVDDAATRRLMEVFYTNLWFEEMGKAEALWQAKQVLRDEGHPPAHWAGWVLTGDPD